MSKQSSVTHVTDELPEWLRSHMEEVHHALDNNLDPPDPKFPRTRDEYQLRKHNLECLFERILPQIAEGKTIQTIVALDHNGFTVGEVMSWIRSTPERARRLDEAKKIRAEVIADDLLTISDSNELADTQQVRTRIDTRKWLLEKDYPEKYSSKSTIDINSNHQISIVSALEEARSRMRTIDVTPTVISLEGETK